MALRDTGIFYRNGSTRLSLVVGIRGNTSGYHGSEGWEVCSGRIAIPSTLVETDDYTYLYDGNYGTTDTDFYVPTPMTDVAPVWQANRGASTAELTTLINDALESAGWERTA